MAVWSVVKLSELPSDNRFDAEYFKPEYLTQEYRIESGPFKRMHEVAHISDGNHLAISEQFADEGVRYLRGQDLNDFFISDSSPLYIPHSEYDKLKRSHMFPGDVLVGIVGTIGSVGVVTDRFKQLTGNCKLAIVRPHELEPEFIAAYLASTLGQNEIRRRIRGAVQMGLILPDLKDIPVPLLSEQLRANTAGLVREAYGKRQESISLYAAAESLLLSELGLNQLALSHELTYETTYGEMQIAERMDAEFYQPKFAQGLKAIRSTNPKEVVSLGSLLSALTNGHTPLRHDLSQGEVLFLTAEHILDYRINFESEKRIELAHHNGELKRTRVREGDFLVTIKGRIGNFAYAEDVPGNVNINQDVGLFRIKNCVPLYYLLAYLNSPLGKLFSERLSTSQINPFLGLGNLRKIPVPLYNEGRMLEMAASTKKRVRSARVASEESKQLLAQAKKMVEEAIMEQEA